MGFLECPVRDRRNAGHKAPLIASELVRRSTVAILKRFALRKFPVQLPWVVGAQGRNRTTDTGIFSPLLYRLSYLGLPGRVCMPHGGSPVKDFARSGGDFGLL